MTFAEVNGICLSFEDRGSGEPILMVMGTGARGNVWHLRQTPALLAGGFRVITFDNRGMPPSAVCPEGFGIEDMAAAGITARPGQRRPRLHDLRHSFTVWTLLEWYRDGGDVQARLPLLSTWLGHVDPKSTYWYLQAAPELLALAAQRLERVEQERR